MTESEENLANPKWTENSIYLLLSLRLNMEKEFRTPTCSKTKLWENVSKQMLEEGCDISGADCHLKYRNMLKTYKKNKDKQRRSGASRMNWKYFEMFDRILSGQKRKINPFAEIIDSLNSNDDDEIELNEHIKIDHHFQEKQSSDSLTFTSSKNWEMEYFQKKLELKKEDIERKKDEWLEKREIEKSRIEAIKNLTKAMQDYTKCMKSNTCKCTHK